MLLAIGTLWFWLFLVVFLVLEFLWIEFWESAVGATVTLVLFFGIHYFWGDPSIFKWVADNPDKVAFGLLAYFVAGCIWGFVKWFLFLKEKAREYQENRRDFLRWRGHPKADLTTRVPEELRKEWQNRSRLDTPPKASQHKSTIITWMAYWPWSALWTMIRDPFLHMYNFCAERLEKMSSKVFERVGFDSDHEPPPEKDLADEL